ncbi:unnamed protein product [Protopolystoma xenopodis]|uniref:G-protein coupled receptors family 1 profile domain-containing protein n=1 Tax=Protopolystoma xenopodis TaxID=117903 RepID=A0A3S5A4V8_9PLAT|nr:unnamed protein product [Protopolystoma xenopodis]
MLQMDASNYPDDWIRVLKTKFYAITVLIVHFIIPITIGIGSYLLIYLTVVRHTKEVNEVLHGKDASARSGHKKQRKPMIAIPTDSAACGNDKDCPNGGKALSDRVRSFERRIALMTAAMLLSFVISWGPYAGVVVLGFLGKLNAKTVLLPYFISTCALFAKTSGLTNPIVFVLFHPKFTMNNLFKCFGSRQDDG